LIYIKQMFLYWGRFNRESSDFLFDFSVGVSNMD